MNRLIAGDVLRVGDRIDFVPSWTGRFENWPQGVEVKAGEREPGRVAETHPCGSASWARLDLDSGASVAIDWPDSSDEPVERRRP